MVGPSRQLTSPTAYWFVSQPNGWGLVVWPRLRCTPGCWTCSGKALPVRHSRLPSNLNRRTTTTTSNNNNRVMIMIQQMRPSISSCWGRNLYKVQQLIIHFKKIKVYFRGMIWICLIPPRNQPLILQGTPTTSIAVIVLIRVRTGRGRKSNNEYI